MKKQKGGLINNLLYALKWKGFKNGK